MDWPMGALRQLRLKTILARPKVIKAIKKVGRLERFNPASEQI